MGANFCGFRRRARPRSLEKDLENDNCGLTESVMKFLKPRSLWGAMKVKQKQSCLPEKQELQLYRNSCKVLTLEDWIMSSPGFNKSEYTNIGGEMPVHKQSSRRIHPSFYGDLKQEILPKPGDVEISVSRAEAKNVQVESENARFCRTKSGKVKKKVSFRSPVVADVFVLDASPEIHMIEKE